MRSISSVFGFDNVPTTVNLVEVNPSNPPVQKTVKATPEMTRVSKEELEYAYVKHPIVFSAINKATQAIMSAGYELRAKDPKVFSFFTKFIENVGTVGEQVTFNEILESLYKYQMIYADSQLETVIGKNTEDPNNIVDLVILDPKRIDYAKTSSGKIVLDNYGMPVGYTQQLPFEVDIEGKGDTTPDNVSLASNQIFLLPYRIAHFKMHTFGDRFYPMGMIEAGYKSILYEIKLKKLHVNSVDQKGEPPVIDYVGDQYHQPTPQQIDNATNTLSKFKYNRYFAFPYWHRIEALKYKPNDKIIDSMKYLREDIVSSLGMPLSFATGSGEDTNRSTLNTQHLLLTYTLNDLVKRTMEMFRKRIFARICEFEGFEEVPEIVWNHVGIEEINDKSTRIVNYVKSGVLTEPDDLEAARDYAVQSERLINFKNV